MHNSIDNRWSGYVRSVALLCWSVAVVMTLALGWSAWRAYDTAGDAAAYAAHRDAGVAAKSGIIAARR
jgi:hypothetical protein